TKIAVIIAALIATPVFAQSARSTMKAIVVHEYGGPEVLKYEDAPRPEPKENEILVKVIAAGVNPVDSAARSQKYARFMNITLPAIPGYDIAGIVERTGTRHEIQSRRSGLRIYRVGQRWRLCGIRGGNG